MTVEPDRIDFRFDAPPQVAASINMVRTALLAHAAHQLNKLKSRHVDKLPVAAE